jgi:hypothetical protein
MKRRGLIVSGRSENGGTSCRKARVGGTGILAVSVDKPWEVGSARGGARGVGLGG